jgi:hypothetical protein
VSTRSLEQGLSHKRQQASIALAIVHPPTTLESQNTKLASIEGRVAKSLRSLTGRFHGSDRCSRHWHGAPVYPARVPPGSISIFPPSRGGVAASTGCLGSGQHALDLFQ